MQASNNSDLTVLHQEEPGMNLSVTPPTLTPQMIEFSIFTDKFATQIHIKKSTWGELRASLENPEEYPSKDHCPLLKLATFGNKITANGSVRTNDNMLYINGIECDYDGEKMSIKCAAELLTQEGIRAILYTTASHTQEKPRYRVIAPLSRSYLPSERAQFVARVNHVLGGTLAPESFTPSQAYYLGKVKGRDYQVINVEGEPIDNLDIAELYPPGREPAPPAGKNPAPCLLGGPEPIRADQDGDVERVRQIMTGDCYHNNLRDLAASLVATGMQPGAAVNHLRALMDNSTGVHDGRWTARRAEIPKLVESAVAKYTPGPEIVVDISKINKPPVVSHSQPKDEPVLVRVDNIFETPPEPPQYIVEELVPRRVTTLLGAHGGVGKTTLALIMVVRVAIGLDFFGKRTEQCKVLFFSAEDEGEHLRYLLAKICLHFGIDPHELAENLVVMDATDIDPALFREVNEGGCKRGTITPAYTALHKFINEQHIDLAVIDNASDVYDANEIERRSVRAFIRSLARFVKQRNGAVLLLAHVDKIMAKSGGGNEGYSGSTAWNNSVRSRLFMGETLCGGVTLEHQKSNRGKKAEPLSLHWIEGVLELDGDGTVVATALITGMEIVAVLKLVDEFYNRGEFISPAPSSPDNMYKKLHSEKGFPKALGKDRLTTLVREADRRGFLERQEYRTVDRKPKERWCVTEKGQERIGIAPTCANPRQPDS